MKSRFLQQLLFLVAVMLFLAPKGRAANVDPGGYTNSFASQPLATDWATFSRAGAGGDTYDPDADANANITAAGVTNQTVSGSGDPVTQGGLALWSSTALYLETRPTANRYTALMGKFVNNTGTNATQIAISYLFTIAGTVAAEDAGKGTRVYYSLSGLTNSWINLPYLNTTASNAASSTLTTNVDLNWTNGGNLYLLWIDDNGAPSTDVANEIDNFSLQVTAGAPPMLGCIVTAPTNRASFVSGTALTAAAAVANGTAPYTVEYFMSSGAGNTAFASAGSSGTAPYNVALGNLAAGTYNIYAVVTDSGASPGTAKSVTNTFFVADRIIIALTAPPDGALIDNTTTVTGVASVSGGTQPYSVQFYLDNVANGAPITSLPYQRDFGTLFVGDHTIRATVTDASGWVSNSLPRTVHITGPLGVDMTPTNGAVYNFGQPIVLAATPGGGTAPYNVSFYTNDRLAGTISSAPFSLGLGLLPAGNYTTYVHATDSSAPTQQASSSTNTFTIVANPILVTLTNPTNGQSASAGQAFTMSATANVGTPVTITNVEFFMDGISVGANASVPYNATIANPAIGVHTAYAAASDGLGRKSYSSTNQVSFAATSAPANDQFANAFVLTGPIVSTVGYNNFATKQFGQEPFVAGNFGGASVWWFWTASGTGLTTIDTFGSDFNTLLGVYTGTAANQLSLIADNNDYNGNSWSRVQFTAVAGTVYRIMVDGFRAGGFGQQPAQGNIRLNIQGVGGFTIDTPTNGMVFTVGDPIPVAVSIQSDFPNPPATRVDFYLNGNQFASSTTAPFSAVASNAPAGSNAISVVVYDSAGTPIQSSPITVLVQNVGVTLISPFDGTTFLNTNPIPISAWTYLPAGTITSVEFFADGISIGNGSLATLTNHVSTITWSNVLGGSHRLTAVGHSDSGGTYNSQPVNIAVAQILVASNSVWKYLDDGTDQGTAWYASDFDDNAWGSGPAPLGFGDSMGRLPLTTNSFGPDPNNKYTTTYYRQSFTVNNAASYTNVILNIQRDDGAVVYLNGAELARFNMPTGAITYATFAAGNASDDGTATFTISVKPGLLHEGANVFAVEIHQDVGNSSDIWFVMELLGIPPIIRNQLPIVAITSPTNTAYFVTPASVQIDATASDADGTVSKVEFFVDGNKIGEAATPVSGNTYSAVWNNPTVGIHELRTVATDDQNGRGTSAGVLVVVYDAAGTPLVRITSPANGAVMEGPTNLLINADAFALAGVANVQFFANGLFIGQQPTLPYSFLWPANFLSNGLSAVAIDANGLKGTSSVVSVTITIPPTNTVAPYIVKQTPAAGTTITNLTSINIIFSERIQGIDASDLLVGGVPATGLTGSGANYTFTFPQPPYSAEVEVTWAADHGITDFGWPSELPFDELAPSSRWDYNLVDRTLPTIAARSPLAGSTVTNLQHISVTFSEAVSGVDASDLLVNGVAAFGVNGSGSNYVFDISQPPSGSVSITWATNHGIADLAEIPNAFIGTGANAVWSFTLDSRTLLVQSNSTWQFFAGTTEASSPTNAWRMINYDEGWPVLPAPFFFGDPYTNATISGTYLSGMQSNYSSIYLRKYFTVANRSAITNLYLNVQIDDGFVAWINGVEVRRFNVPAGELSHTNVASAEVAEPNNAGAVYTLYTLTNTAAYLVNGQNVLAVHALNRNINNGDFGFNAQLYTYLPNAAFESPRLTSAAPAAGEVFYLTNITVTFSEPVSGVDAADLLVNGVAASSVNSTTNTTYTFAFPQPAYGAVVVTWAANHGIVDFDDIPKPFNANAASSTLRYTLLNPSAPTILSQTPTAGTTITGLTSITITFSEPVAGVDAADLLIGGTPASTVSTANNITFTFSFPQPTFGAVAVRWAANNGITDIEIPPNAFDTTRPSSTWNYTLINPIPSVTLTSPTNGAYILAPADIPLRANATDNDGTVQLVEFFEGINKLAEGTNAPYTFTWSNITEGSYVFRAVVTDNMGLRGTSAPVVVTVVTSLPVALVRGPYLQVGTPNSGIIRWRTDLPSDSVVFYGTDEDGVTNLIADSTAATEHIVSLTELTADTKYYYSIGSGSQRLASGSDYWFKTSPLAGTRRPVRFWALGDSGTGNQNAINVRNAFYNFAATNGPADFWLMLGDNAYNSGLDTEYQTAVFNIYPTTLRNLFLWPTIGNHETQQAFTIADFPYLHIFTLPQNGEAGGVASGSPRYYSFDYANIHFICLDSMSSGRTTNTAMVQWLVEDLEAASADWLMVFFHHPPYTKGNHNSDTETELIEIRQNILPILESHGVDVVFNGHSHDLERSYLLDGHYGLSTTLTSAMKIDGGDGREDGTGAYHKNAQGRGVVYTVCGSSGQITGGSLNHPAHYISLNELGSLVVDVNDDRMDVKFLTTNGLAHDHYTIIHPNKAPIASDGFVTLDEDTTGLIKLTASDPERKPLTYTVLTVPTNGTAQMVDGNGVVGAVVTAGTSLGSISELLYTPVANFNGLDGVTFKANDGKADSGTGTITITVRPVNDPPVADASATPQRSIISANGINALAVLDGSRSHDVDQDPLQFVWREGLNAIGTGMVWTATLPIGLHNIVLEVSDGFASSTDSVGIEILGSTPTVQPLIDLINNSASTSRMARPLIATLEAARDALSRGSDGAAINQLQAFQNKVRAQVAPVDPILAAQLIAMAQAIIDAIGDPGPKPKVALSVQKSTHTAHIAFSGNAARPYIIEASSDLAHWAAVGTATHRGQGQFEFSDSRTTSNTPARFYRVRVP